MRKAMILVLLLLCSALPFAASTGARSVDVEISMMKYDWYSNDTIEFSVKVSNAPFGSELTAEYAITDLDGSLVQSGSSQFQPTGPNSQFPLPVKHFFQGSNFYFMSVEIINLDNAILANSQIPFMVFQNTIMPQIGNLLAFGDSLSDMGNAKDSILSITHIT